MKELALPSKVARLGDRANKARGEWEERVDLGTQTRRREGRAFAVVTSANALAGPGFL